MMTTRNRGGVDEDDPPSKRQQDALDALKQLQEEDGDMTVKGVAEAMEAQEDNVQILLAGLYGKGLVTRHKEEGAKAYSYTPKAA